MRIRSLTLFMLAISACPRTESRVDAGVDAGAGPGVFEVDGGAPIASLEPTVMATFVDGGTGPVSPNGEIDSAIALTVALAVRLKDFRIRILDYRDQVVASDDDFSPDERLYRITLAEALKTGRPYTMRLDAELGPVVTDDSGGTWNDWELNFRISGEVQVEVAPAALKKTKKRRTKGPE